MSFTEDPKVSYVPKHLIKRDIFTNNTQSAVDIIRQRTEQLFQRTEPSPLFPDTEQPNEYIALKLSREYESTKVLPPYLQAKLDKAQKKSTVALEDEDTTTEGPVTLRLPTHSNDASSTSTSQIAIYDPSNTDHYTSRSLIRSQQSQYIPDKPEWHAPWKLMRVIAGHQGWVRCMAVDPENKWFATGSADNTIKVWDLASGALKLTLTNHSMAVRGLAISERHPYMFSCGEDKKVLCWDLEKNSVVRDYYGHLSGVYTVDVHPTLNVVVTGSRDSTVRVWDMRSATEIFTLTGHKNPISNVKCQGMDPQIISTSEDKTIRLWDLAAGKTQTVLTHHTKSIRALALHPEEWTFATASPGSIKQWKFPEGSFMQNMVPPHAGIINSLSVSQDNVLFSGGDDGKMGFYDWKSGHKFQEMMTTRLPGSLDSEAGIQTSSFDKTGMRLITGETDKSIKIWREDPEATPDTHPGIPFDPENYRQMRY
ncbi:CYFA0S09e00672g1_1 [Cyberlindnera fabianii]|uniref:Pre-mRNA-splicing factor PRP46 n=1 Tax=Cyberlindnera fabianii TaxID=36022 RepID=A0A061AXL3_CYBFA|nr:Pre-mRNA-splicing factor prp46 [Cyberlindnera fabianii]CDR42306.1 CYFA0S09e00672g1_1 [Cyberlindnera fabianii]